MSIYRVVKNTRYFVAANEPFHDKRLSWEARGVMAYLLSKPDGWDVRNYDLENQAPAGERVIRRIVKELVNNGYMHRERVSAGKGKINLLTTVYESPALNPFFHSHAFHPMKDSPHEKRSPILNTDPSNTDLNKYLDIYTYAHDESAGRETDPLQEMISTLSTIVKETFAPGVTDTKFEGAADGLLRRQISREQVTDFGKWWSKEGWYPGKPALRTLLQEIDNSINNVTNGQQKNGRGGAGSGQTAMQTAVEEVIRKHEM